MSETQLAATAVTREADLEYFCVVLFGRTEDIAPLTKKFSLFR